MKYCPNCGSGIADEATFCPTCGNPIAAQQAPNPGYAPPSYSNPGYAPAPVATRPARPAVDPADHTAEFDAKDISENKVVAMLIYLAGYIGIFVALLLSNTSKYTSFHVRQALKIEVTNLLASLALGILSLPITLLLMIPILNIIVGIVFGLVCVAIPIMFFVIKIVSFIQICKGQAKEPILINKLPFLK